MKILVVTYNVLFGYDPRMFDSLQKILKESKQYSHTFIALQEVRHKTPKDTLSPAIQKIFPLFTSATLISPKPSLHDLGLMTLSSLPILDSTPVLLPRIIKRTPLHGALITRYNIGGKILRVTNVHFNVLGGIRHKKKQMNVLSEYLNITHADNDIICGDFNTIGLLKMQKKGIIQQKNIILRYLGKRFEEVPIPSWTSDVNDVMSPLTPAGKIIFKTFKKAGIHFRQKLDWIFVRGFKKMHADVHHELTGSDHYPIFSELEL